MYKVFDKEKLEKIAADHAHWLAKDCDGCEAMRADLRPTTPHPRDFSRE